MSSADALDDDFYLETHIENEVSECEDVEAEEIPKESLKVNLWENLNAKGWISKI